MLFCRRGRVIDRIWLTTRNPSGLTFGNPHWTGLFPITGTLDTNKITGEGSGVETTPPAGQLLMITCLDKGIPAKRACCYS